MTYARKLVPWIMAAALVAPVVAGVAPVAAAKKESRAAAAAPSKSYRQFTGTVVALDGSTITVEKGGKTPKQMAFSRHAGMRSVGDLEKDARVTVYWRDEAGKPVAHRVVVKTITAADTR